MSRLLLAVLALAALGYLGYRQLYGAASPSEPVTAPTDRLQNVKAAARRIEAEQQQRADDALEKTGDPAVH